VTPSKAGQRVPRSVIHGHADHDEDLVVLLVAALDGGIGPPGATGKAVICALAGEHELALVAGV